MLPTQDLVDIIGRQESDTNHARTGKSVPAESDAITLLEVGPLVLQGLVVHLAG